MKYKNEENYIKISNEEKNQFLEWLLSFKICNKTKLKHFPKDFLLLFTRRPERSFISRNSRSEDSNIDSIKKRSRKSIYKK